MSLREDLIKLGGSDVASMVMMVFRCQESRMVVEVANGMV